MVRQYISRLPDTGMKYDPEFVVNPEAVFSECLVLCIMSSIRSQGQEGVIFKGIDRPDSATRRGSARFPIVNI